MASDFFLQLPNELGGLRFGPFRGRISLGSDPTRCQLVVDAAHGVFPVHAIIAQNADGSFTIAPQGGPNAKVFLTARGQAHLWPITTSVQARIGDVLVVGTPAGPQFTLADALPRVQGTAKTGEQGFVDGVSSAMDGMFRPAGSGIRGEINRQLTSRALTSSGPVRAIYIVWTRFKSGSLFSPPVLVGLGIALIALLGSGAATGAGLLYLLMDTLGIAR